MKKVIMKKVIFIISLLFVNILFSKEFKINQIGCITEEKTKEIISSIVNDDKDHYFYMLQKGGCTIIAKGTKYSIIELGFSIVKIRIYNKDKSAIGYIINNLQKEK